MQLFVRGLEGGLFTVELQPSDTVADLKRVVSQRTDIELDSLRVHFQSKSLYRDDQLLADAGLQPCSTLDVNMALLGGKVHGSLARAGKVRGQTPKVERKEKRKKKTGRAKRRMQYKRRFVNVVVTGPGRRRGPNSNM